MFLKDIPVDTKIFDFLVGQHTVVRLATVGNAAVFLYLVFAKWYFLYCDPRSIFDLACHVAPPIPVVMAVVSPKTYYVYYDQRNIWK